MTPQFLVSCEHATSALPPDMATLFQGAGAVLASHRGWDAGALPLAQALAARWRAPLLATTVSRLVCDANRSAANPAVWSAWTHLLPPAQRAALLARWHTPHWQAARAAVENGSGPGRLVLHVAAHSFVPELAGRVRTMDVGLLYDPARPLEQALARGWQAELLRLAPQLRVRRNAPYRGAADGLPTWLRREFSPERYAGFELECNQALLAAGPFPAALLAEALERALAALFACGLIVQAKSAACRPAVSRT